MTSVLKLSTKANKRCTVVLKPIPKHIFTSSAILFLERCGHIVDVTRRRNTIFATYSTPETAALAVELSGLSMDESEATVVSVELYTHEIFSATPEKEVRITWAKKDASTTSPTSSTSHTSPTSPTSSTSYKQLICHTIRNLQPNHTARRPHQPVHAEGTCR